jgi:hypothetical protein
VAEKKHKEADFFLNAAMLQTLEQYAAFKRVKQSVLLREIVRTGLDTIEESRDDITGRAFHRCSKNKNRKRLDVDPELYKKLDDTAQDMGCSKTDLVGFLIEKFLDRELRQEIIGTSQEEAAAIFRQQYEERYRS